MTGIGHMQSLFSDVAATTRDAIAKGDDISMDLACRWLWYMRGLAAGARLADYTCEMDRLSTHTMLVDLAQIETEYNERLREKT